MKTKQSATGCTKATRLAVLGAGLVFLTACAVTPSPLTGLEQRQLVEQDRALLFSEQAPVSGAITLEEALARALKYNMDQRLMLMEEALRNNQLHLSRYDMLPALAANSGYTTRSNENLNLSRNTRTGDVSTDPSISQDRNITYANLGLTWNILDFGVSYYQAHQNADQFLVAQERRRSVVNQVVQEVRAAYWRAATAEPLYEQIRPVLAEARAALNDARAVEEQRLSPPLESLQYQKGLVEVIRELETLEMDLAIARSQLASLMGLPPGTQFSLALPEGEQFVEPTMHLSLEDMEEIALMRRPELVEEHYQQRISANETRKALLRQFPGLQLTSGYNYDSNSYLVNQTWADAGVRLSWNLLNLASAPAARRTARAAEDVTEMRRLALSMAALTQVNVGYQQYLRAQTSYEQAQLLDDIEQRIFGHVRQGAQSQAQSPLQQIRAQMAAIYAEVNTYRAYAELHGAVANLYVSIGLDLLPDTVESHELASLTETIRDVLSDWNSGNLSVESL